MKENTEKKNTPTSQPQGELREREALSDKELKRLLTASEQGFLDGEVEQLLSERLSAEVAATIERCVEIVKAHFTIKGTLDEIRSLATAPQISALAVKMAEARLEGSLEELKHIDKHLGMLVGRRAKESKWVRDTIQMRIVLQQKALAAAKER